MKPFNINSFENNQNIVHPADQIEKDLNLLGEQIPYKSSGPIVLKLFL